MPGPIPRPGMPPMNVAQATKWRQRPTTLRQSPSPAILTQFFFAG